MFGKESAVNHFKVPIQFVLNYFKATSLELLKEMMELLSKAFPIFLRANYLLCYNIC